jgi:hypothetical protein
MRNAQIVAALFVLTTAEIGCIKHVRVPKVRADHQPTITILSTLTAQDGTLTTETFSSAPNSPTTNARLKSAVGIQIQIIATANNPGGVQTLVVTVTSNGVTLFTGKESAIPDSKNRVPDTLRVATSTDGRPIIFTMSDSAEVSVSAEAINFNSMSTGEVVVYETTCPPCDKPNQIATDNRCSCSCPSIACGPTQECCGSNSSCCQVTGKCIALDEGCSTTTCSAGNHLCQDGLCCQNGTTCCSGTCCIQGFECALPGICLPIQ